MSLFELSDVSLRIGDSQILSHVSIGMQRGEIVTIVGPNGSGKSTLLRMLIGSLAPREGRITKAPGLRIGYVPQRLALDPTLPMTVARLLGLRRKVTAAQIEQALDEAGVAGLSRRQVSALSGGQLQRVMLARALLAEPDLLVLDEATQGLDQPGVAAFYRRIEEVRQSRGCGVLMVSHDLHVVMSASEIPLATMLGSTSPAAAMASKAPIIPETVPRKPRSGAMFATVESQTIPFSRKAISMAPDSVMAFSTWSRPRSRRSRPACKTEATGPGVLEHISAAASGPPCFRASWTRVKNSLELTCALLSV